MDYAPTFVVGQGE